MRAITVKQPWPYLIFHAGKDVENRSQNIALPLPLTLAIHVSRSVHHEAVMPRGVRSPCLEGPAYDPSLRGKIIGVVTLEAILPQHSSKWYQGGRHAYVLSNPRLLKTPLEAKGALSHWEIPPETLKRFRYQGRSKKR